MIIPGSPTAPQSDTAASSEMLPLVTIITAVRNGLSVIEGCIESVRTQDYPRIEHIVVDGSSDDGTTEFLRQRIDSIDRLISEPDEGIYDAINKGIRSSTGDIIGILNVDDRYAPGAIRASVEAILSSDAAYSYGAIRLCKSGEPYAVRKPLTPGAQRQRFLFQIPFPHPSMFVRSSTYSKIGLYDTSYTLAADHDFIIRLITSGASHAAVEGIVADFDTGGRSNSIATQFESFHIARRYGCGLTECMPYFALSFVRWCVRTALPHAVMLQLLHLRNRLMNSKEI